MLKLLESIFTLQIVSYNYNYHNIISAEIQGQKEIDELKIKLQEMRQLHESAVSELQSLKSEYKNLLEEKVWLASETEWVG